MGANDQCSASRFCKTTEEVSTHSGDIPNIIPNIIRNSRWITWVVFRDPMYDLFKTIKQWFQDWKEKRKIAKKLKALRERDPFIYK